MDETRQSLLLCAKTGETNAWKALTDLYRPLILGWLNRQGVPAGDMEDLSQEVLLSVVTHLPNSSIPASTAPSVPGCALSSLAGRPITGWRWMRAPLIPALRVRFSIRLRFSNAKWRSCLAVR
jgi:hypothetical protein